MVTEADTCTKYVVPKLKDAGWDDPPRSFIEQHTFTDGRIVVAGQRARRRPRKRADYLLRYRRDYTIAVVEAKAAYKLPGDGLQQAKDYAEILGLKFAYSTNGDGIIEFNYLTGKETPLEAFPTPEELWTRIRIAEGLEDDATVEHLLTPSQAGPGRVPRYYQEIAINRAVQAILQGKRRVLLTMATGTGKTLVAFQVCWKLWNSRWNATGEHRRPRILYLADRNILIDDPKDKTFVPFGDARWKIENGEAIKSREMYFAIYQAMAKDERRPGLYRQYPRDFFDFIVVDECHRGSARDQSNWREILEYFSPAYQLGMTATPLRQDNRDTYRYFGSPVYTYSLRQGIEDGFLAPYRVHRIISNWDAAGWRPSQGDLDRYGRDIPDEEYLTKDFERAVALRARTKAIAFSITEFLKQSERFAKTIVFCVDQEHADEMRRSLINLNSDLVRQHPNYVCRVTTDEGDIGLGHLSNFQDLEKDTPAILTTSRLLTTGVDAPTCKNVVLARVINSMTEFKQIIGRGTRVREDYGKLFFNILDYTNSTRLFADPEFDGYPAFVKEVEIDEEGKNIDGTENIIEVEDDFGSDDIQNIGPTDIIDPWPPREPHKLYFDGGQVDMDTHLVYELDPDGRLLRVVEFVDYTAEKVRTLYPGPDAIRPNWINPVLRAELVSKLEEIGIDLDGLASAANQPDADSFDLLCHVAFNSPLLTRKQRAERLRSQNQDFFERYGPQARAILEELLDKYAEHGTDQIVLPDVLRVPPISEHGNIVEIARIFGGPENLRESVDELQSLLYAA